jgi:hypothetical protein
MADQSGRLAAVAQKVERFEGKLTEVTNDLDPDDRREAGFASKIARARRDNDINDLANDLKTIGSIVGAQKRDFDRATQRNTDLEAENRNLRNEGQQRGQPAARAAEEPGSYGPESGASGQGPGPGRR